VRMGGRSGPAAPGGLDVRFQQARRLWVGRRQDCGRGGFGGSSRAAFGRPGRRRAANGISWAGFSPKIAFGLPLRRCACTYIQRAGIELGDSGATHLPSKTAHEAVSDAH
jgi:hypothetical protein